LDFTLSSDQALIKDSVDRFVTDNYSQQQRAAIVASEEGFSREHWAQFASLGWLGIAFPENRGGFGGSPVETMILAEAFGKGLVLEPFVPSVVLGGTALAYGSNGKEHADLLEAMIGGEKLLTFAYAEERSRYDYTLVETQAREEGSDLVITGKKLAVPYAASADTYVVTVRTSGDKHDRDGITVVLVDRNAAGLSRRDYHTVDDRRASTVTFDGVRVPKSNVLGEIGKGLPLVEQVIDAGIGALAAEAVGNTSVLLRRTVEYLKTRKQFGVPIGSFQALQHRAVDMLIQTELSRSITYYGTMALTDDNSPEERMAALSATKVQIARSGRIVGESAIQLHGGIGMSEEYVIGHYFKRISMIELELGDADFHLGRYVALGKKHAAAAPSNGSPEQASAESMARL
jgi:alkylation response protein AidB-like acyl-CoA dehydrogenase